MHILPKDIKMF